MATEHDPDREAQLQACWRAAQARMEEGDHGAPMAEDHAPPKRD